MTLNALNLHFLKYLTTKKVAIPTSDIKSKMLGYENISPNDVFEELISKEYVTIKDNKISITGIGKKFIENLEKIELENIQSLVFDDFDKALIGFLFSRNDFVNLEDFPEILKKCAPQHGNSIND